MKFWRIAFVVFGALSITALGIDAADTIRGAEGTLLSQVIGKREGVCPSGMVEVDAVPGVVCADVYEASAGSGCSNARPEQILATKENMDSNDCMAESKAGALPWRFVTRDQAMHMCARSGKRLPTSDEWYRLSLGMTDNESQCNISSKQIAETGKWEGCRTPVGMYDMVGNAWEWVSDDIVNGLYRSAQVPNTGYVAQVDASGMATAVGDVEQELFGNDYFWSRSDGAYGVIRGGYYDSGSDGGVYAVHADTPPTTAGTGIGFRCVK